MRRPWFIPLVLAALLGALAVLASARVASQDPTAAGSLALAARVRADEVVLTAPSLSAGGPPRAGSQPVVAGRLSSVDVSAGVRVEAGQVVAAFDEAALALGVARAEAAARAARARVGILDDSLDTLGDKEGELADARVTLADTLAKLRASRADVLENLQRAQALAGSAPATLPPGTPDPRALVSQLQQALARIDAGIAKATAAQAQLRSGAAQLDDARSTLRGMRGVVVLAADATDAGVAVAEARRALAQVRTPYAGVVTWAAEPGSVVFVGGPVVRIRPDGPLLLDAYVDDRQARLVSPGASAEAANDSWPGRSFPGRVVGMRPVYEYPPTALPTSLIHLTRAFKVTVSVDDSSAPLPPGTPADLIITTRSE